MHASMTTDGIAEDRRVNDLMSYAVFYEALQALDTNSSVLHELSNNPRWDMGLSHLCNFVRRKITPIFTGPNQLGKL